MRANALTSMTVSLPKRQKDWVKKQAAASGCSTPSEYVRRLIHADQVARERERLEQLLLEGLDSPSRVMTDADWERMRTDLARRCASRRASRKKAAPPKSG